MTRNWRYVTGTFQVKIPVQTDATLLPREENTLSIFKWRLANFAPKSRWRPVLERYISYLSKRVDGFGGRAGAIEPSLTGIFPIKVKGVGHGEPETGGEGFEHGLETWIGKVSGLVYDPFGEFKGFWLELMDGDERRFGSREHRIEDLVRVAWGERILVSVQTSSHHPDRPTSVTYRRAPRPFEA